MRPVGSADDVGGCSGTGVHCTRRTLRPWLDPGRARRHNGRPVRPGVASQHASLALILGSERAESEQGSALRDVIRCSARADAPAGRGGGGRHSGQFRVLGATGERPHLAGLLAGPPRPPVPQGTLAPRLQELIACHRPGRAQLQRREYDAARAVEHVPGRAGARPVLRRRRLRGRDRAQPGVLQWLDRGRARRRDRTRGHPRGHDDLRPGRSDGQRPQSGVLTRGVRHPRGLPHLPRQLRAGRGRTV